MPDIVSPETRSRMMAGIRGKDTKPERLIRKALHRRGFRYRLHDAKVPGKPDILFPKYRAAVLVHGCFWHGHDCPLFRLPGTRTKFWLTKIEKNRARDREVLATLKVAGWHVLTVWECAFRGRGQIGFDKTVERIAAWLVSASQEDEIRGKA